VVIALGAVGAFALSGNDDTETATPRHRLATTTTTAPTNPDAGPFGVATTKVASLPVFASPDATGIPVVTLPATTTYGLTSTLLVDWTAVPPPDWVPVVVPLHKPNGSLGWVQAKDVALSQTSFSMKVSLSQHTLTVLNAGAPVFTTKVIIGAPATSTPIGRFYIVDPLNCNKENVPGYPVVTCSSVYGSFAMGLSALSEKLDSFDGTIAQIAIHGTNLPDSEMGKDLSNGCVRIPNAVIVEIAKSVPLLGVPVTIGA
jgi:lipoprotein-anchoring transpeptidase ErfK/SrfK